MVDRRSYVQQTTAGILRSAASQSSEKDVWVREVVNQAMLAENKGEELPQVHQGMLGVRNALLAQYGGSLAETSAGEERENPRSEPQPTLVKTKVKKYRGDEQERHPTGGRPYLQRLAKTGKADEIRACRRSPQQMKMQIPTPDVGQSVAAVERCRRTGGCGSDCCFPLLAPGRPALSASSSAVLERPLLRRLRRACTTALGPVATALARFSRKRLLQSESAEPPALLGIGEGSFLSGPESGPSWCSSGQKIKNQNPLPILPLPGEVVRS